MYTKRRPAAADARSSPRKRAGAWAGRVGPWCGTPDASPWLAFAASPGCDAPTGPSCTLPASLVPARAGQGQRAEWGGHAERAYAL
eukprot:scaffold5834_cov376-Prasinococcus_capsulatus_cf.AAC.5